MLVQRKNNMKKTVGVAFADTTIKQLGVSEFIDNELYSNLESFIIQLGVKECLLHTSGNEKDYEGIKIKGILARCNVVVTERKKGEEMNKNISFLVLNSRPFFR